MAPFFVDMLKHLDPSLREASDPWALGRKTLTQWQARLQQKVYANPKFPFWSTTKHKDLPPTCGSTIETLTIGLVKLWSTPRLEQAKSKGEGEGEGKGHRSKRQRLSEGDVWSPDVPPVTFAVRDADIYEWILEGLKMVECM